MTFDDLTPGCYLSSPEFSNIYVKLNKKGDYITFRKNCEPYNHTLGMASTGAIPEDAKVNFMPKEFFNNDQQ